MRHYECLFWVKIFPTAQLRVARHLPRQCVCACELRGEGVFDCVIECGSAHAGGCRPRRLLLTTPVAPTQVVLTSILCALCE